MNKGRRAARRAAIGGAVLAAAVLGAPPALAADRGAAADMPGFLEPSDLPPDPFSAWYFSSFPTDGPLWPLCVTSALPDSDVWNATYSTPETAGAEQLSVTLPTEAEAVQTAARFETDVRGCKQRMEQQNPNRPVTFWDHGGLDVEEGAHTYGIGFQGGWGYQNQLVSVGRDGRTVTVVTWESNWGNPPVDAFKATTRTAVNKLH
ncbi:hypothetical protein [Streptomyces spectabilis]|uniref:Sensor domain-containing protein n=1 Tax=Streptomyces spectabilis TaxID=68270 RepID=A0A516RJM7_STRST|nr:hypothetical protein [Streptomyces spectabilis]QDQ15862.1 hypothetical protein FH965_39315 [Streptomyces spectabilis]